MSRPIILWNRRVSTVADDAGVYITKSIHPPPYIPGSYAYTDALPETYYYVPSLTFFCLKSLFKFPDLVNAIGDVRLRYEPPVSPLAYDILRALIPTYSTATESDNAFNYSELDPRLWATLVQIYNNLPEIFYTYKIPLSDEHLPLLQRIPSTPQFSLITILELPGCPELTDETVTDLKVLHSLAAFDASGTALTTYGIKALAGTVLWTDGDSELENEKRRRRGPWGLRILRLRNCAKVDNAVFASLRKFVLLSVVDMRGTKCIPNTSISNAFRPGTNKALYSPSSISTALSTLSAITSHALFSSTNIFTLHINHLNHKSSTSTLTRRKPSVAMHNSYVVFPPAENSCLTTKTESKGPSGMQPRMKIGSTDTLSQRNERQEEEERYEKNKHAWYERNRDTLARMEGSPQWGNPDEYYDENPMSVYLEESDDGMHNRDCGCGCHDNDSSEDEMDDDEEMYDEEGVESNTADDTALIHTTTTPPQSSAPLAEVPTPPPPATTLNDNASIVRARSPLQNSTPHIQSSVLPVAARTSSSNLTSPVAELVESSAIIEDPSAPSMPTSVTKTISTQPQPNLLPSASDSTSPSKSNTHIHQPLRHATTHVDAATKQKRTGPRVSSAIGSLPRRQMNPITRRTHGVMASSWIGNDMIRPQHVATSRQPADNGVGRQRKAIGLSRELNSTTIGNNSAVINRTQSPWNGNSGSAMVTDSRQPSSSQPPVNPPLLPTRPPTELVEMLSAHSHSIESEFQNFIAEEESREYASRRAAVSFYQPRAAASGVSSSAASYFAEHFREPKRRASHHDDLLMLFREPPPWSQLEEVTPGETDPIKPESRTLGVAVVSTTNAKAKDATKLVELVSQARQKRKKVELEVEVPRVPTGSESRNPFRRKVPPDDTLRQARTCTSSISARVPLDISDAIRPLKPISSLRAPPLPEGLRNQTYKMPGLNSRPSTASASGGDARNKTKMDAKLPFIGSKEPKPKPKAPTSTSDQENPKGHPPILLEQPPSRMRQTSQLLVERSSTKASDPVSSNKNRKARKGVECFDWGTWSTK